jgi:multiple sugar transport system permease protein
MSHMMSAKRRKPLYLLGHASLLLGGLVLLYPVLFIVLVGFMTKEEYASTVIGLFPWPEEITFKNYATLVFGSADSNVQTYFVNSLLRTGYSVVWACLTSLLAGYVFARLKFAGRETLFLALLASQMIPGVVGLIPTFIQYARWPYAGGNDVFFGGQGILDSFWVYVIGGPAINIMGTFLMKQSLEKLPYELEEAARVDGASLIRIIFCLVLPLQKPILAFIAITTAIGTWNDWSTPFFFTSSDSLQTLPAAITRLSSIASNPMSIPDYPLIITLGLGVTLPALLLFFFFQRYMVEGLANSGLKG